MSTNEITEAVVEELSAVEKATDVESANLDAEENPSTIFKHVLVKPFEYEGKQYTELSFDFDKLTGKDSLAVERELMAMGRTVVVRAFSPDYLVRMCARACTEKVGHDIFDIMSVKDYAKITNASKRFF